MKNTDWYKKDTDEILNYYYEELSNQEMKEHLMFWIDNFPELDFEWVDLFLDISDYDSIPVQQIKQFADKVYKINPDYYLQRYEFVESEILDYAFHTLDIELIKERLEILKKNPVTGIDTVVTDTFYRLFFFGYTELASEFSLTVWKPLAESEELWGSPEDLFIKTNFVNKLEKQYEFLLKNKSSNWESFIEEIEELGFEREEENHKNLFSSLTNDFEKDAFLDFASKEKFWILYLNIHFMKYMKKNYDTPFVLSALWFNSIDNQDFFKRKNILNFFIPYMKLDKYITERYDNFLGSNQIEIFGKMWGLHYVFEFFNNVGLIDGDDYNIMLENIAFLKHEFIKAMNSDLWKFSFVFTWPESKSNILQIPQKLDFNETYQMDYYRAKSNFNSISFDIKGWERIESEIIENEKNNHNYHESLYNEDNVQYVKESKDVGRNDPCPCGSGKKYKKCCMNKPKDE